MSSPLSVAWERGFGDRRHIEVINHWLTENLEAALLAAPTRLETWARLEEVAILRCTQLTFLNDSFKPLDGCPFAVGAAQRILVLLDTLDRFRSCFDGQGTRTPEGQRLYQDHFTGEKSWFSDSSDAEKHDFRTGFRFRRPGAEGEYLFCSWHGKVKSPQLRIHFSWPVRATEPLYIAYVGPKITKK
jgi:hypothetical protein